MQKKRGGYGVVYQDVTRNKNISAAAKGLYAYLSAFCGTSDECYPSVETITREMGMVKDTFYKHVNALVAAGVIEKRQGIGSDGKFGRTLYRLSHKVEIHDIPFTENSDTVESYTDIQETISNNITNNNITNNNNKKVDFAGIIQMYNDICKSYPKVRAVSEARKKTIRCRMNTGYTVDDFQILFEKAEASDFLKGKNNRDWTATFDWLIKDGNMAKVLDGNYDNRGGTKGEARDEARNEARGDESSSVRLY